MRASLLFEVCLCLGGILPLFLFPRSAMGESEDADAIVSVEARGGVKEREADVTSTDPTY